PGRHPDRRDLSRRRRPLPEQGHLRKVRCSGRGVSRKVRPRTRMIHGGIPWDPHTGAVTVPLHLTSTFRQQGPGEHAGYEYARTGNPTRAALERLIADLEGGVRAFAFSSGMAATSTIFALFEQGDHFVVSDDVYGGTYRVLARVFARFGFEATFVDTSDTAAVAGALRPNTRAIFVETPTNPLLKVKIGRAHV